MWWHKKNNSNVGQELTAILEQYPPHSFNGHCPPIDGVINYCVDLVGNGWHSERFENMVRTLSLMAVQTRDPSVLKVYIYGLGVVQLEDCQSPYAEKFFQWAIALDSTYHPAYNRLGDYCYLNDKFEDGIRWYHASIIHCDGQNGQNNAGNLPVKSYKWDSLLKVGLCLIKTDNRAKARPIIEKAKQVLDDDYRGYEDLGYKSWKSVETALSI